MKRWIVPIITFAIAAGAAHAGVAPVQGKDKGHDSQGQATSECNHRANERNLKGQDRKDYVEWCESRGARYKYDYKRYDSEKNCYQKANNKGLTGGKRSDFLDKCFAGK